LRKVEDNEITSTDAIINTLV